MILNSKSLIQKVKKVKFNDSSISHIYEHNSCVKKTWASLSSSTGVWNADTSTAELAEPTGRLRVCSLQHLFSLQSFDWSTLWHHRAWLRLDMLNPESFYSLYDLAVAFDFKKEDIKHCLKTLFWLNPILNKAVRDPFIKPSRPIFVSRPMVSETLF